jgi:hypothetical protein
MGQYAAAEVQSAAGRADAIVKTKEAVYVFEFKLSGTVEEALRQIDEKGYLIPWTAEGKKQGGISAGRGAGGENALHAGCFWPPAGPQEKRAPCFFPPAVVSRLYAPALVSA